MHKKQHAHLANPKAETSHIWLLACCITAVYFGISYILYANYAYTGLDLAIFNNTFWNTTQGNLFEFSFHGSTYLGDHASFFILILAPFYAAITHPLMLLFLQASAIGIGIIPFNALAKKVLNKKNDRTVALTAYIFSVGIASTSLSEFHMLSFFIPLALTTYYFYHTRNFTWFIVFFIISLTIREDIALTMWVFSLLAIIDKKSLKWKAFPFIFSILYGYMAFATVENASGSTYKFLFHYGHLGASFQEIIQNAFTNPLIFLSALQFPLIITFAFYLLVPVLFIPLFSKKHLLFLIPPSLQFGLAQTGILAIIQTHYLALFAPFLLIATLFGYQKITHTYFKEKRDKKILMIFFVCIGCASHIGLSGMGNIKNASFISKNQVKKSFYAEGVHRSNNYKSVASALGTLPHTSTRKNIYPWTYILKGKQQYTQKTISTPQSDFLILDSFESLLHQHFFDKNHNIKNEYYLPRNKRIELIEHYFASNKLGVELFADEFALFSKNAQKQLITRHKSGSTDILSKNDEIAIHTITTLPEKTLLLNTHTVTVLPVQIEYSALTEPKEYDLRLKIKDANNLPITDKIIPLTYSTYPTDLWKKGEYVTVDYQFIIPEHFFEAKNTLSISLVRIGNSEIYNTIGGIEYQLDISKEYEEITITDSITYQKN